MGEVGVGAPHSLSRDNELSVPTSVHTVGHCLSQAEIQGWRGHRGAFFWAELCLVQNRSQANVQSDEGKLEAVNRFSRNFRTQGDSGQAAFSVSGPG